MSIGFQILNNRETTSFGLSIGLGLMLESIFPPTRARADMTRVPPNNIKIKDYDTHYFSLPTIALSIYSAISDGPSKRRFMGDLNGPKEMIVAIREELMIVNELFEGSSCKVVLFIPDLEKIVKNSLGVAELTGEKFKMYQFLQAVCKLAWKEKDTLIVPVVDHRVKLPSSGLKTLITTSFASDLLNIKYISKLELLEPHTGKVKKSNEFNSKYKVFGNNDLSVLPFTEKLLYIMGDKHLIPSASLKIKKAVMATAVKHLWTFNTKNDKIVVTLKDVDYNAFLMFADFKRLYL